MRGEPFYFDNVIKYVQFLETVFGKACVRGHHFELT